ncbi:MAG: hypothetical protein ABID38_00225 [Candidatus Diapherotrites archaeon]
MRRIGRPMTSIQWKKLKKLSDTFHSKPRPKTLEEKMALQEKKERLSEEQKRRQREAIDLIVHNSKDLWTFNFKMMFEEEPHGRERLKSAGYSYERLRRVQPKLVRKLEEAFKMNSEKTRKYIFEQGRNKYIEKGQFELLNELEKEVGLKLHKIYLFLRRRGVTNQHLL